jgi:hypothetical protein
MTAIIEVGAATQDGIMTFSRKKGRLNEQAAQV